MSRPLIDLLWRDHPAAPTGGRRGPRARVSTSTVVDTAIQLADADGLAAVTIRRLADALNVSPMSIYTHVNSRDDLLVLMTDAVFGRIDHRPFGRLGWRKRVVRIAKTNLALHLAHPWLHDIDDDRTSLGPGTIAKYDHELDALTPLGLDPVTCDATLTFILDFVRASARALRPNPRASEMTTQWPQLSTRLAAYVGDDFPLARSVGAAAGEAMGAPYNATMAWDFGLARVIDAIATMTSCARTARSTA